MSNPYVVLARKWRSSQFEDIVGQTPVVRTLMNAIRTERVHQAYLLTGTRGIGKTSIARILAKALRCEHNTWTSEDPRTGWLRSCGVCSSCKEITTGTSVDVIEIDGASNNGVDAVREIRENAKFLPASGSRKIYIIDEVHMLTTAAFNALLKTLEEPPAHVVFIVATTEPHKIPATILSRVQRFDLKRVNAAQIQAHLSKILETEKVDAEPAALAMIARAGEGSMRDALSLLDQVIAYSGSKITVASARESIGLVESQLLLGILRGVVNRNAAQALEGVQAAFLQGNDLKVLTRSLIEFLYGAILIKAGIPRSTALEFSDEEWTELTALSQGRELSEFELIFQALHQGMDWIARSPQPKVVLDVLLIKCALAEALVTVDGASSSGGATLPPQKEKQTTPVAQKVTVQATASTPPPSQPAAVAPPSPVLPTTSAAAAPALTGQPATVSGPKSWEGFIQFVRSKRPFLATVLENSHCAHLPGEPAEGIETGLLLLQFSKDAQTHRAQLEGRNYSEQLVQLVRDYFGATSRVKLESRDQVESMAERRERERRERETAARDAAQHHPILAEAKALFGGELGPIELNDSAGDSGHA